MISQETIETVRERANLIDIISESVSLKRQGSGYVGLCPFHGEKTPSFSVRGDGSFFHCFGCGASGNAFTYVMQQRGLSFPEAVEELASRYGIAVARAGKVSGKSESVNRPLLYRINGLTMRFFSDALHSAEAPVRQYLQDRAVSDEAIKRFGIGYAPRSWNALVSYLKRAGIAEADILQSGVVRRSPSGELYDVFRGRIIFPVWSDAKRVCAFGGRILPAWEQAEEGKSIPKYLNSAESPIYHKSKVLYGLPQTEGLRQSNMLYLVEGYMDVVGLWQTGVRNVLATCGTAVTAEHARRLARLVKRVVVLFDGDAAGQAAAARCFSVFINSGLDVEIAFLEQGMDPDDLARKHRDKTAARLEALPRASLLESYVRGLLSHYGVSRIEDLGAANKGKLCEEVALQLKGVKNGVERQELMQQAARQLLTDAPQLKALMQGAKAHLQEPAPPVLGDPVTESDTPRKELGVLPKVDRELLIAVMAKPEEFCAALLQDYEICAGLDPVTLLFVSELHQALGQEKLGIDVVQEKIREILRSWGRSWIEHWKKARAMLSEQGVDFKRSFADCRVAIKKNKLNQELARLRGEYSQTSDEHQKLRLSQEELALSKQIQGL